MSYMVEGTVGVVLGVPILLLHPLSGIALLTFGIIMLAVGGSAEAPGQHADRCGWLGHDWRVNLSPASPGKRCRNCLRVKGQPATVFVPMAPPAYYQATSARAYGPPPAPGYGPTVLAQPGFAPPGYDPGTVVAAAPTPTMRAAYAPPIQQLLCPACNSPVQAGMAFCPWCNRPFA